MILTNFWGLLFILNFGSGVVCKVCYEELRRRRGGGNVAEAKGEERNGFLFVAGVSQFHGERSVAGRTIDREI